MTLSILAFDPNTNEIGVAVQSKLLAVGSVVPAAQANVGAVVSQSIVNTSFRHKALELLKKGWAPDEIIVELLRNDDLTELRQLAIINNRGEVAAFTGENCLSNAGHIIGSNFSVQGNRLKNKRTIKKVAQYFESSRGPLAERLLNAMEVGLESGADREGEQAASLLVLKNNEDYDGVGSTIDLRVDDHKSPITELKRLYNLYKLSFLNSAEMKIIPIEGNVKVELAVELKRLGFLHDSRGSEAEVTTENLIVSLTSFLQANNFHARIQRPGFIDEEVLTYIKQL